LVCLRPWSCCVWCTEKETFKRIQCKTVKHTRSLKLISRYI
jgi:hypothetical protein